jgi:hypothetical protein
MVGISVRLQRKIAFLLFNGRQPAAAEQPAASPAAFYRSLGGE